MNRLCRDVGHDWQNTTGDNFRRCKREDCKTVQRLDRGQWVDVARVVIYCRQSGKPQQAQQGTMF